MRRAIGLTVATLVACVTVIVVAPGLASAGFDPATVNVKKIVVGDPPAGTTFVVRIECGKVLVADLTFDATGGMQSADSFNPADGDCVVSEPQDGGANSTTFACEPVQNVICDTTSFELESSEAEANITVTNTFPEAEPEAEPAAAEPVAAEPAFTG